MGTLLRPLADGLPRLDLGLAAALGCAYRNRAPDLLFAAALSPFLLNLFGLDCSRWAAIGLVALMANLAFQRQVLGRSLPDLKGWRRYAMVPICLPLGPAGAGGPLPWIF